MAKLKLFYSVANGGDGSAYPVFFVSEDLAEWHQERLDEGWGEPCTGDITVEGDNLFCKEALTKEGYYLDLLLGYDNGNSLPEFVKKFYPDGIPSFTVSILNQKHYVVMFKGQAVYESFAYPEEEANEEGRAKLEKTINDSR